MSFEKGKMKFEFQGQTMKSVFGGQKLVLEYYVEYKKCIYVVFIDIGGLETFTPRYTVVEASFSDTLTSEERTHTTDDFTDELNTLLDEI